jgi:hypothetical protein
LALLDRSQISSLCDTYYPVRIAFCQDNSRRQKVMPGKRRAKKVYGRIACKRPKKATNDNSNQPITITNNDNNNINIDINNINNINNINIIIIAIHQSLLPTILILILMSKLITISRQQPTNRMIYIQRQIQQ